MPVYVGRISQGQNYIILSKELAIIGTSWCVIRSTFLRDVMHVNYMVT